MHVAQSAAYRGKSENIAQLRDEKTEGSSLEPSLLAWRPLRRGETGDFLSLKCRLRNTHNGSRLCRRDPVLQEGRHDFGEVRMTDFLEIVAHAAIGLR